MRWWRWRPADGEADPLYDQAVDVVIKTRRPSISLVQRRCVSGFTTCAARLIEQMERIGPSLADGQQRKSRGAAPAKEATERRSGADGRCGRTTSGFKMKPIPLSWRSRFPHNALD